MLSYIASNPMEDLIKGVCEELNITILSKIGEIDFLQYIKETKVNFKLIKYKGMGAALAARVIKKFKGNRRKYYKWYKLFL